MSNKIEGLTMNQLVERNAELQSKVEALAVESGQMLRLLSDISGNHVEYYSEGECGMFAGVPLDYVSEINTYVSRDVNAENPFKATDAALAEIRAQARAEGIYFTANRLLAAWDAGFIDSPDKGVIDVARMILSAAEMLPDAVEGDFSREFADEMMGELTKKLRKEAGQ